MIARLILAAYNALAWTIGVRASATRRLNRCGWLVCDVCGDDVPSEWKPRHDRDQHGWESRA